MRNLKMNRRNFIEKSSKATLGIAFAPEVLSSSFNFQNKTLKIGIIGTGLRGQNHISILSKRSDVEITCFADPDKYMLSQAQKILTQHNRPPAKEYKKGVDDYMTLLKSEPLDAVIIATPWDFHIPQALAAIDAGVIPGVEVCGARTIEECWELVRKSEDKNIPVMVLENVCYRRDILAIHNMVKKGLFGEILHCQGGYMHDLRGVKFNDGTPKSGKGIKFGSEGFSESKWRTQHSIDRNGDIYPTHGLGPIANMIDINRGNRLTALSSIASKARGLHKYIVEIGGKDCPQAQIKFKLGDIVTTQLQSANGETIVLTHNTNNSRPYNIGFKVQGTDGIWQENWYGKFKDGQIFIESLSDGKEMWQNPENLLTEYDHPLWKKHYNDAAGAGHGGMDFFVINAFVESIKRKVPFPLDVYDLATWYAITPLSEKSIAEGGQVQLIPDFTNGKWQTRKNTFGQSDEF
ncbi:MAG: Gfo/Idh/MocA family oxidoreductase [Alphaproteobacteria bacterium]|nr:Gfo/Idh/MocA family oxidoreductase [Alphaproteobacteria bacterium]